MGKIILKLGHSPDADDAFMFYALAKGRVKSDKVEFIHIIEEIQSLNERAIKGELDVTAVSAHAYLLIQGNYRILSCGASMGKGYGPIVVAREDLSSLKGIRIAIPGKLTTAYLLLSIYAKDFIPIEFNFDSILEVVKEGEADAGLVIHEGQLTYDSYGLKCVMDLGALWSGETSLPLPLGINVLKRGFDMEIEKEVLRLHQESIEYALNHKDEALQYALQFGRGMKEELGERFVLMYVNEYTREMGEEGRRSLQLLFSKAYERGLVKAKPTLDILGN